MGSETVSTHCRGEIESGRENGVDGDPRLASAELGRIFIDFKVEAGVAAIRSAIAAGK